MNYSLLYSVTLLICFILTLILFHYHSKYWNPVAYVSLQCIYLLNMVSTLLCTIWVFIDGKTEYIILNYIVNMIEFNCMGLCGYFWFLYCLNFVDMPRLKTRAVRFFIIMPLMIVMALIVCTFNTHWAFYIDEEGFYQRGSFYIMQQIGYIYLILSSALCIFYRKRCTTSSERQHLSVLARFPLSPAIFGAVQILVPSGLAPTLQFSILVSLFLVFADELDQKITRDSLTQLINRYEFERILQNKMHSFQKDGLKLYVLMSDMNNFKNINDTYGHQQGDISLRTVGFVMTKVAEKYNAVCARMSGDEFISLIETNSLEDVFSFNKEIEEGLENACAQMSHPLQLSTGFAEYDGKMTLMQLMNQADLNMYKQKKKNKQSRN